MDGKDFKYEAKYSVFCHDDWRCVIAVTAALSMLCHDPLASLNGDAVDIKVISRFMGWLENRLSDFDEITAIGFVIADLV